MATSTACGAGTHGDCNGNVTVPGRFPGSPDRTEQCDCTCHSQRSR
jgi:hypothetical protein